MELATVVFDSRRLRARRRQEGQEADSLVAVLAAATLGGHRGPAVMATVDPVAATTAETVVATMVVTAVGTPGAIGVAATLPSVEGAMAMDLTTTLRRRSRS